MSIYILFKTDTKIQVTRTFSKSIDNKIFKLELKLKLEVSIALFVPLFINLDSSFNIYIYIYIINIA